MTPEAKLAAMGLVLPEVPKPVGTYLPYKISGDTLYLSGQGPRPIGGTSWRMGTVQRHFQFAAATSALASNLSVKLARRVPRPLGPTSRRWSVSLSIRSRSEPNVRPTAKSSRWRSVIPLTSFANRQRARTDSLRLGS